MCVMCVCFRVSKLLFPPIPQPPKKIKLLLEREDLFQVNVQHTQTHTHLQPGLIFVCPLGQIVPTPLSKYVDDITIVEEAEETPEKDPVTSW